MKAWEETLLEQQVTKLEAENAKLRARLDEAERLLERVGKYIREDRAVTPGVTRLARVAVEINGFLPARLCAAPPADSPVPADDRRCPRCEAPMSMFSSASTCDRCAGLWTKAYQAGREFERIYGVKSVDSPVACADCKDRPVCCRDMPDDGQDRVGPHEMRRADSPVATPEGALRNVMAGRLPWNPGDSPVAGEPRCAASGSSCEDTGDPETFCDIEQEGNVACAPGRCALRPVTLAAAPDNGMLAPVRAKFDQLRREVWTDAVDMRTTIDALVAKVTALEADQRHDRGALTKTACRIDGRIDALDKAVHLRWGDYDKPAAPPAPVATPHEHECGYRCMGDACSHDNNGVCVLPKIKQPAPVAEPVSWVGGDGETYPPSARAHPADPGSICDHGVPPGATCTRCKPETAGPGPHPFDDGGSGARVLCVKCAFKDSHPIHAKDVGR